MSFDYRIWKMHWWTMTSQNSELHHFWYSSRKFLKQQYSKASKWHQGCLPYISLATQTSTLIGLATVNWGWTTKLYKTLHPNSSTIAGVCNVTFQLQYCVQLYPRRLLLLSIVVFRSSPSNNIAWSNYQNCNALCCDGCLVNSSVNQWILVDRFVASWM